MNIIRSPRSLLNVPYRLRSPSGDLLSLHQGKYQRVTVHIADEPLLLTARSRVCCVLVRLAISAGASFELGGFLMKARGCHVPVILLRLDLLGLTLGYTPSLVAEALHEDFFRQFPSVELLVQDSAVFRRRGAAKTIPAKLGEELNAALVYGSRKTPATIRLLSPNGVDAEVVLA